MFSTLFSSLLVKLLALLALLFNFSPFPMFGSSVTLDDSGDDVSVSGPQRTHVKTPAHSKDTSSDTTPTDTVSNDTPSGNPKTETPTTPAIEVDDLADAARAVAQANYNAAVEKYERAVENKTQAENKLQALKSQAEALVLKLSAAAQELERLGVSDSAQAIIELQARHDSLVEQREQLQQTQETQTAQLRTLQEQVDKAAADRATAQENLHATLQRAAQLDEQIERAQSQADFAGWDTLDREQVAKVAEAIIFAKVNEYRTQHGLPELALSESGLQESREWSKQMAADGFISHNGFATANATNENVLYNLYGRINVHQRVGVDEMGVRLNTTPELLAESMFMQWKYSAGHDKNLLSGDITSQAIGLYFDDATNRVYATMRGYTHRTDLLALPSQSVAQQYGVEDMQWHTDTRGASTDPLSKNPRKVDVSVLDQANLTPDVDVRAVAVDVTELQEQRAQVEQEIQHAQSQLAQAETTYTEAAAQRDEQQAQLDETTTALAQVTEEISQVEQVQDVVQNQQAITEQVETLNDEVVVASVEYTQAEAEVAQAEEEVEQAESELENL